MSDEYPQFRTVLRGYDPAQVEDVLDEVFAAVDDAVKVADDTRADLLRLRTEHEGARTAWQLELEQARARVAELERSAGAGPATFANLGTRIGSMLSAADEEAAEIRRSARVEAQQVRDEAQQTAATTRAAIEHDVAQLRAAAEDDADTITQRAQRVAVALRADVERDLADVRQRTDALYAEAETSAQGRRAELDLFVAERREQADAEHAARLADHEEQLQVARARVEATEVQAAERLAAHEQHRELVRVRVHDVRVHIAGLIGPATGKGPDVTDRDAAENLAAPAPASPEAPVPDSPDPRSAAAEDLDWEPTVPAEVDAHEGGVNHAAAEPPQSVAHSALGAVPESAQQRPDSRTPDGADESFEGEPWSRETDQPARRRWTLSARR